MGMKAPQSDKSIYGKWSENRLVLILSTHVDDLKGGGVDAEVTGLIQHLEKTVGKGKMDWLGRGGGQ